LACSGGFYKHGEKISKIKNNQLKYTDDKQIVGQTEENKNAYLNRSKPQKDEIRKATKKPERKYRN
jgi:hypothetical protein